MIGNTYQEWAIRQDTISSEELFKRYTLVACLIIIVCPLLVVMLLKLYQMCHLV